MNIEPSRSLRGPSGHPAFLGIDRDAEVHTRFLDTEGSFTFITVVGKLDVDTAIKIDGSGRNELSIERGGLVNANRLDVGNGGVRVDVDGARDPQRPSFLTLNGPMSIGTPNPDGIGFFEMGGGVVSSVSSVNVGLNSHGGATVRGGDFLISGDVSVGSENGFGDLRVNRGGTMEMRDLFVGASGGSGSVNVGGTAPGATLLARTIEIGKDPNGTASDFRINIHGSVEAEKVLVHPAGLFKINGGTFNVSLVPLPLPPEGNGSAGGASAPPPPPAVNVSDSGVVRAGGIAPPPAAALPGTLPASTASLTGHLVNNGTVVLGGSGGFVIQGNFEQGATGRIVAEVGGKRPGKDYGQIVLTGATTLGGKAVLQFMNGFAPKEGQKFDLIAAPGVPTGDFSKVEAHGLALGAQIEIEQTGGIYRISSATDAIALPTVSLRVVRSRAFEKNTKAGSFIVSRTGSKVAELVVQYAVGGTALPGDDYAALSGTVTISAGKKTAVIPVTPVDDANLEQPETVEAVVLPGTDYTHSKRSKAKLTIIDND